MRDTREKKEWILNYLNNKQFLKYVDVLEIDFVNGYIEKFEPKFDEMTLGAPKCKELSALLSEMYRKGLLRRFPHGVKSGLCQDGRFPKWVYSYELPQ